MPEIPKSPEESNHLQASNELPDSFIKIEEELKRLDLIPEDIVSSSNGQRRTVGKFEVIQTVAIHQNSVVFKARDPDLDRIVALKLCHGELSADKKASVMAEGQAHAKIDCPYVTRCHNVESVGGVPMLVNEWIVGQPLDQYSVNNELTFEDIRRLFNQILIGIKAIHDNGLLHRDIKPSNIVISESGTPKILDFGLAQKLGDTNVPLAGTYAYMAPEVARGNITDIGIQTDIFGLGGVLYYLLTGSPLYDSDSKTSTFDLARKCSFNQPVELDPNVPAALNEICCRCLSEFAEDRFQSVDELMDAVRPKHRAGLYVGAGALAIAVMIFAFVLLGPKNPVADPGPTTTQSNVMPSVLAVKNREFQKAIELANEQRDQLDPNDQQERMGIRKTFNFCVDCSLQDGPNLEEALRIQDERIEFEKQQGGDLESNYWLKEARVDRDRLKYFQESLSREQLLELCSAKTILFDGEYALKYGNNQIAEALEKTKLGYTKIQKIFGKDANSIVDCVDAEVQLLNCKFFFGEKAGFSDSLRSIEESYVNIYGPYNSKIIDLYEKTWFYNMRVLQDLDAARVEYDKWRAVAEKMLDEDSRYLLLVRLSEADLDASNGNHERARATLEEAVDRHDELFPNHFQTGQARYKLAEVLFALKQYEDCDNVLVECGTIFTNNLAKGRMPKGFLNQTRLLQAKVAIEIDRPAIAIQILTDLLAQSDLSEKLNTIPYAKIKLLHGQAYSAKGDHREATIKMEEALAQVKEANKVSIGQTANLPAAQVLEIGSRAVPFHIALAKEYILEENWSAASGEFKAVLAIADRFESLENEPSSTQLIQQVREIIDNANFPDDSPLAELRLLSSERP